ncbi:hypothetical protein ERUR111494_01350 [Erysipelothrix urinaevulpis]|uniref:hypothetical protein n=1 Tax=Erysipelothrix urinaevulpis TaxID=2683717 RepID=UPI00135A8A38|nr:hypothetical protein [Erysipelothrix urinaevulpis]
MAYKIEENPLPTFWAATMKMTIPEYSVDLYERALKTLTKELQQMGVEIQNPEYNFTMAEEKSSKIELIDVELAVAVVNPGVDTNIIKFKQFDEEPLMIRIKADEFMDIHTGIAEWLHDNGYEADGNLRRVLSSEDIYVYDCPYKPSED